MGSEMCIRDRRSSIQAFDKVPHDKKRLIIMHKGKHRLLQDNNVNWEIYQNINLFIKGIILPDTPILVAEISEFLLENEKKDVNTILGNEF